MGFALLAPTVMTSTFKSLIDVLNEIRTPLIFWGFCGIICVIAFYIFSKNNEWFREMARSLTDKLRQAHLYKLMRLAIMLMFAFFMLLMMLTFTSPLIDKYMQNAYSPSPIDPKEIEIIVNEIQNQEPKSPPVFYATGYNAIDDHDVFEKYRQAVEDFKQDTSRVKNLFNYIPQAVLDALDVDSDSDTTGSRQVLKYILDIDSLSIREDWAACAERTLLLSRKLPTWNSSLKCDLAFSLNRFRHAKGPVAAVRLVEKLKKKHPSKILSYFWPVIPIQIILNLDVSLHKELRLTAELHEEISQLIESYPQDPWIDYAYYAIGDFENGLRLKTTHLRDMFLFAEGYNVVRTLKRRYQPVDYSYDSRRAIHNRRFKEREGQTIKHGIECFKKYISEFPHGSYHDESVDWLIWLYTSTEDYENALTWERQRPVFLEDDDFRTPNKTKVRLFLQANKFNLDSLKRFFNKCSEDDRQYAYFYYTHELNDVLRTDFQIRLSRIMVTILEKLQMQYPDSVGFNLEEFSITKAKLHLLEDAKKKNTVEAIAASSIKLRKVYFDRQLAINLLHDGLITHKNDYLAYLRIICYREYFPLAMQNLVSEFSKQYPKSELLDDVLAEYVYVQSYTFNNFPGAKKALDFLNKHFPINNDVVTKRNNAVDNAFNWYAFSLLADAGGWESDPEVAISKYKVCKRAYQDIVSKFNTRWSKYAGKNIKHIQARIKQLQAEQDANASVRQY